MQKDTIQPDFDFGQLYDMTGGDPEIIRNLLQVMRKNLTDYPPQIHSFGETNDWVAMGQLAHKLKSSIAYLGFDGFTETLSTLEKVPHDGLLVAKVPELLTLLYKYTKVTLQEIDAELSRL